MQIRTATLDDADSLALVHVQTWQAAYAEILPAGYLAALDLTAWIARWRRNLAARTASTRTLVAEDNGKIVGFASVGPYRAKDGVEPGIGEVYAIYAHPTSWSTGAGRALTDAAIAHLTEAGLPEIRLWVFADNPRARRFYERAGFVPDGTSEMDTIDPEGPYETTAEELRYTRPQDRHNSTVVVPSRTR